MHRQAGKPSTRRERWSRRVDGDTSLTFTARLVGRWLALYGDPDGRHIFPSQQRLAHELQLATGTVSRAICELEDAGWVWVQRWRPTHDPTSGRWFRRENNHYTLCTPPVGLEGRGRRRRRRRRYQLAHETWLAQRDQERAELARRREEAAQRLVAEAEAQLDRLFPVASPLTSPTGDVDRHARSVGSNGAGADRDGRRTSMPPASVWREWREQQRQAAERARRQAAERASPGP